MYKPTLGIILCVCKLWLFCP